LKQGSGEKKKKTKKQNSVGLNSDERTGRVKAAGGIKEQTGGERALLPRKKNREKKRYGYQKAAEFGPAQSAGKKAKMGARGDRGERSKKKTKPLIRRRDMNRK